MKRIIILLSMISLVSNVRSSKYCDIKGNVNNPGVYEIKNNYTIQDIINEAGGLKKNSYTKNINLSKKVTDEMVVYIFSNAEIKDAEEIKTCVCEDTYVYKECDEDLEKEKTTIEKNKTTTNKTTTKKTTTKLKDKTTTTKKVTTTEKIKDETTIININTCTLEELMTVKGLGEKKAQAIIDYRNEFGGFETIEDLVNVKGIGVVLLEKIREYIEV